MLEKDLENLMWKQRVIQYGEYLGNIRLMSRQLPLLYGHRADFLGWSEFFEQPMIIELKIGEIKERDVSQLLRYMGEFGAILQSAWYGKTKWVHKFHKEANDYSEKGFLYQSITSVVDSRPLLGLLVGTGNTKEAWWAMQGAGYIDARPYKIDNDTVYLGEPEIDYTGLSMRDNEQYKDVALSIVELYKDLYINKLGRMEEHDLGYEKFCMN